MQDDVIAVFPLPNVIFFPHTDLPLHIFEPRYCEMVADTIENKQLIGMFLLQPGWQDDYYGNPAFYSIGCAGEVIHVESLAEGKFNIILRGISRVRAIEPVQTAPYRKMRVHFLPEMNSANAVSTQEMKKQLLRDFKQYTRFVKDVDVPFTKDSELVEIVNFIASTLETDIEEKRKMLEQSDIYQRALAVQEYLSRALAVLKLTASFGHLRPTDPNAN